MKAVKATAVVILCIILLTAEGMLMGIFAVDRALSEDSIRTAIADTDIAAQLVDEALAENTVNMGGQYGEIMKAVFKTDAMTDFFTAYLVSAIHTEVYGKPYEEVAYDELMEAFSQGLEEVGVSEEFELSPMEEELLKQAIRTEGPDLTAKLNQQVEHYETLGGDAAELAADPDETVQFFMGTGFKLGMICICLLICAGIATLCWRSKLGLIWCGIVTALMALIYGGLSMAVGRGSLMSFASSPSEELALSVMEDGFGAVSKAGFIITAVFLIIFIVLKIADRRRI